MKRNLICKVHNLRFKTLKKMLSHLETEHPMWYAFIKDMDNVYDVVICPSKK